MLKFCVKDFKIFLFLNPCMDLLYIWYDKRYNVHVLVQNFIWHYPTPTYDLKVRVRDLEIYVKVLC